MPVLKRARAGRVAAWAGLGVLIVGAGVGAFLLWPRKADATKGTAQAMTPERHAEIAAWARENAPAHSLPRGW